MAKDFLTPKEVAKRIKSRGLQKLRWYCQMCQKQCRDENGFKCHCTTEGHRRQMQLFGENPDKYLNAYSKIFLDDFLRLLSRRFGTRRVFANRVYQEFIADRDHQHMNSTRWQSLSGFVMYLGREGLAEVDETEEGWYIKWIDKTESTLSKQDAVLCRERMKQASIEDDEAFNQKIDEAMKEASSTLVQPSEFRREDNETPIRIKFQGFKPAQNKITPLLKRKSEFLEKAKQGISKPLDKDSQKVPSEISKKPKSVAEIMIEEGHLSLNTKSRPKLAENHK